MHTWTKACAYESAFCARTGDVSFLRITVTMAGNICYRATDYAGTLLFEYLTGPARSSCNSQGTPCLRIHHFGLMVDQIF